MRNLHSPLSTSVVDESFIGSGSSLLQFVQRALLHRRVNSPDSYVHRRHDNERRLVVVTSLSSDPAILTTIDRFILNRVILGLPEDERAELRRAVHSAPPEYDSLAIKHLHAAREAASAACVLLCASIVWRPLPESVCRVQNWFKSLLSGPFEGGSSNPVAAAGISYKVLASLTFGELCVTWRL